MQDSQTSPHPCQSASSSIAPTQAPNTVYVVTEEMFGENLISIYSGLKETEIANKPEARQLSAYLDDLNTTSADIYDMRSRVSTALGQYRMMSKAFGGYSADTPSILFNHVDKSALPKNTVQRDLDICKRAIYPADPQVALDQATQALEAFYVT